MCNVCVMRVCSRAQRSLLDYSDVQSLNNENVQKSNYRHCVARVQHLELWRYRNINGVMLVNYEIGHEIARKSCFYILFGF